MIRIMGTLRAWGFARSFGVGRAHALWLATRYLVTGRTGRYRIRPQP